MRWLLLLYASIRWHPCVHIKARRGTAVKQLSKNRKVEKLRDVSRLRIAVEMQIERRDLGCGGFDTECVARQPWKQA